MNRLRLMTALWLCLAGAAAANDTTAEIGAGGLSWVESDRVSMKKEDLFISREEVRVDYLFENTGNEDEESIIAFPMPDIVPVRYSDIAISEREDDNFLGFSVTQDGKSIKPQLQQRITAMGVDWTADLLAQNVPLLPFSEKTSAALAALPEDVKKEWIARGLIYIESYDAGKGMQSDAMPLWTLHSAYWWKTRFPAGKQVSVSHRYIPAVGGTVAMTFIQDGKPADNHSEYAHRYCLDDAFMKNAVKLEAAARKGGRFYKESWLSYILTTGANWNGPIGEFRLTIDKGKAENFVSFCGQGVKKTGPTTFTMSASNFWPEKDLHILFLEAIDP